MKNDSVLHHYRNEKMMKLSALLHPIPIASSSLKEDPEIYAVCYSSKDVVPGSLFVAIKGLQSDGYEYISDALRKGAVAVLAEKPYPSHTLVTENTRKALPEISARFYEDPSQKITLIGVVGTNGKTTTTYLLESILEAAGYNVGVIGTINYRYNDNAYGNPMTTPESTDVQRILMQMYEQGVTHAIMEVSSHSIDLHRVDACAFDVGIFTNFTQDHLDYHQTMDAYWHAKETFFTTILAESSKENRTAVINANDPKGKVLSEKTHIPYLFTGMDPAYDIFIKIEDHTINGITGCLFNGNEKIQIHSSLCGDFNIENISSAAGGARALQVSMDAVQKGIAALKGVPGRLEKVENNSNRYVFVDYAHTPDALKHALETLRNVSDRRLICVFGCGGNRDTQKRPLMGNISTKLADITIITTDNPRSEDPASILRDIEKGIDSHIPKWETKKEIDLSTHGYMVIADRKKAIQTAIQIATETDVVLIVGKGHENYQILGDRTIYFDDYTEAKNALANGEGNDE